MGQTAYFHLAARKHGFAFIFGIVILFGCACFVAPCQAADTSSTEGAIAGYETYHQFVEHLERLVDSSPCLQLKSLAETGQKSSDQKSKSVLLVTVGHPDMEKADRNPAILILGSVEPNRPLGSELCVRLVERLLRSAEGTKDGGPILSRMTFYIIPRPAPDAYEAFFQKPYQERTTNHRPVDDDHDGRIDEDGPDDLNGDGWVTMMRIEDPRGTYIPHPSDSRIMIKADPRRGERGRYLLYREGLDNDHDERSNEDDLGGVALNRNFTFDYDYFGREAGPHQVSEPETRAVADFAFSHPNIAAVFSFSAEDNLMHPWRSDSRQEREKIKTTVLRSDAVHFDRLAAKYRKLHGGKDAPPSVVEQGSFARWAYFHYGRLSLTARGWWIPKVDLKKTYKKLDSRSADQLAAICWFEETGVEDSGFVPWTEIKHPDFPDRKVEVGGFKPFLRTTPPAKELERLTGVHYNFIKHLADSLAKLKVESVKVESLGEGLYRVTATIANEGQLPTELQIGTISKKTYPIQVAIDTPKGTTFIKGSPRTGIGSLDPLGGHADVVWLFRVPASDDKVVPKFQVRAWSPSVSSAKSFQAKP